MPFNTQEHGIEILCTFCVCVAGSRFDVTAAHVPPPPPRLLLLPRGAVAVELIVDFLSCYFPPPSPSHLFVFHRGFVCPAIKGGEKKEENHSNGEECSFLRSK